MPSGRRSTVTALVALALLMVGSGTALAMDRLHAVPAGAALRVGDAVITEAQIDERSRMMTALTGQPTPDKKLLAQDAAVGQVLEDVARERNIVIADKTANDKLTEWLERGYPEGRDKFMSLMKQVGVSQDTLLQGMKVGMVRDQLFEQVTRDVVPPTDQDVAQTYEQRKTELTVPEQRHVRNIAVPNQQLADQVRGRLDRGEDFATVAREVSIDSESKDKGGDLGTATREEIANKAFGDLVFSAAPNSVFGPVQTNPDVWSVGQVLEVTPPTLPPLDAVRDAIRSQLFQIRKVDKFNGWVSERLEDADIRYADGYRPADPNRLPSMSHDLVGSGQPK